MSDYERPFLEDGSQFGVSADGFKEMDIEDQRELMIAWFHQNFEIPENGNAMWEGEDKRWIYIWGGPYDAKEQLWEKFEDLVSEELIDEVVEIVERNGAIEWAPASSSPFYDIHGIEPEPWDPKLPTLDEIANEAGKAYGSPEDYVARGGVKDTLHEFRAKLRLDENYSGIGHNQPPDAIEDDEDVKRRFGPIVQELRSEFERPDPRVGIVHSATRRFRDALIATGKWLWKKFDIAADEAAKAAGKALGVALVASPFISADFREAAFKLFHALMEWLMVVT